MLKEITFMQAYIEQGVSNFKGLIDRLRPRRLPSYLEESQSDSFIVHQALRDIDTYLGKDPTTTHDTVTAFARPLEAFLYFDSHTGDSLSLPKDPHTGSPLSREEYITKAFEDLNLVLIAAKEGKLKKSDRHTDFWVDNTDEGVYILANRNDSEIPDQLWSGQDIVSPVIGMLFGFESAAGQKYGPDILEGVVMPAFRQLAKNAGIELIQGRSEQRRTRKSTISARRNLDNSN